MLAGFTGKRIALTDRLASGPALDPQPLSRHLTLRCSRLKCSVTSR